MKKFKWLLNWSLENILVIENKNIPVMKNGQSMGKCFVTVEDGKIIGDFNLTEELDNSEYVLYMISTPDILKEIWLEGIILVDYFDGSRAKKAENMQIV